MVASARGHSRARACFLEKKRSDDRNDVVRKFLMKGQFALRQSRDLNIWQSCHGLDFGAPPCRRFITVGPAAGLRHAERDRCPFPATINSSFHRDPEITAMRSREITAHRSR